MTIPDLVAQTQRATCPLCHRLDETPADAEVAEDGYWRCGNCGHGWTTDRLATAANYAAWSEARATARP